MNIVSVVLIVLTVVAAPVIVAILSRKQGGS